MPHVSKIARKAEGVGLEFKSACDVETGIMLQLELSENKTVMAQK
jgi:hypothetical protein